MNAPVPLKLAGRYEVKEVLGQGGMGLVYRARDTLLRRDVALKTLRDIPEASSLQLFFKECDVLASMSHPNIVEIFDVGEFEENGEKKPYFVMPLLPGKTLDTLIKTASHRLTLERVVDIMSQVCRGLHTAHERGLVHRDLKPSNIFVMDDDSVKIIDFGVAHMSDGHSTMGQKGTLLYMSPEQIEMKPLSPVSDIFSLSVVCYEALTGRQPFRRDRTEEIVAAILQQVPPPACELNPAIGRPISRVIHKGLAKQAAHRFSSAREFGETLNKALRKEPIEFFDASRLRPRLQRCTKALEEGDFQFAGEILSGLEAEGHIETDISLLRGQLDKAVRQKTTNQLLEAARARYEEEEDPLALQKIQEVLQLDPQNVTALSLKTKIENRRSERQIENWYRLAQQHIGNHSYTHAREALQNVLQMNPQEARAVQLMSEIDRDEQEYERLREEKAQLHKAAMDLWERGEVSTALTKLAIVLELDRRAPDTSNTECSASYETFYNEVRSEHDAMTNAYVEAKKRLAEQDFAKAQELCDIYLAKYPNHAIFQALKFDISEQQRQQFSAFIATVDHNVDTEPDLAKRVNLLKDALARCPGEAHFERALRIAQDKRDLVNSIVARAHDHEEQGQFSDALNDWETLGNIYNLYPGLKFEIERVQKRREQQARAEAKSKLTEQVDRSMQSGQYARAMDLLQKAQPEFPGDAELAEMLALAQAGLDKMNQAQRLMTEGQELCRNQRFRDGVQLLEQAFQLDERNALARNVLCNTLVEEARVLVDKDWKAAEKLTLRALELNPSHAQAKGMRSLVQDRKREQFVNECLSQARRLQAAGDLPGALAAIEDCGQTFPNDFRLAQIRDVVRSELASSQQHRERRQDLDELRQLQKEAEGGTNRSFTAAFDQLAQTLLAKYPDDDEFASLANEAAARSSHFQTNEPAPWPSADKQIGPETMPFSPGSLAQDLLSAAAASPAKEPVPEPEVVASSPLPAPIPIRPSSGDARRTGEFIREFGKGLRLPAFASQRLSPRLLGALGGALVCLIILALTLTGIVSRSRRRQAAVAQVPVHIRTVPDGATILLNGQVRGTSEVNLSLTPDTYRLTAQMDGYEVAGTSIDVRPGSPVSLDIALVPAPVSLKLLSDVIGGKVSLDDRQAGDLIDGQFVLSNVALGQHKMKIDTGKGRAEFSFEAAQRAMPLLKDHIVSQGLHAVLVGGFGSRLKVYSSFGPCQLTMDGKALGEVTPDGLELQEVSPGAHQIVLSEGTDRHVVDVEAGPAPSLNAFLQSHQDIGTLLILTGEDDVKVFLDGKLQRRRTQGGQLRVANLEPRQYAIKIAKDGFEEVAAQNIDVKKGEQARLKFVLRPLVQNTAFTIHGGMPGTVVMLDHAAVGTVQADGSFRYSSVSPGDHLIELHKDGYKTRQIQKRFAPGSPVTLGTAETVLESAPGELRISFNQPEADVTLTGNGQPPVKIVNGSRISLPPGSYVLTARTPDGMVRTSVVQVTSGESRVVDLALAPGGMGNWEQPQSWTQEKDYFVHRGGNFVLYKTSPTSGTFTFSALLQKGHRLQWVLNYVDDKNYLLFSLDENFFYRTVMRNGQQTDSVQLPHKTDKKQFRTLQIRVSASEITHQIRNGDRWVNLDTLNGQGSDLSAGKFGFYIPGKDQLALSNFKHYAD